MIRVDVALKQSIAKKEVERWYPLIKHPVQMALINDDYRFKVVPAGRRSGKTERAKRYVAKKFLSVPGDYFIAAPTRDQVKRIYWNDLKLLTACSTLEHYVLESELTIICRSNNSRIILIGLDKPQRIEGVPWCGGIVDEIADVKDGAWQLNIAPALDTIDPRYPNRRAWCWLIGVPDGLGQHYELAERARRKEPGWKLYEWKSADILPPDVIEAAKANLSPREYRQEYEASFESSDGKIYDDYSHANTTNETLQKHEAILWCHDFNYTPMSSAVCVVRDNSLYILGEIVLKSATAVQSAMEFVERYDTHENRKITIYGDPAGRAGEKHGHASDYTEIERVLMQASWEVTRKVKAAAPAIKDRQNSVRAKIIKANGERHLFINPKLAPYAHKGLTTATLKYGSTFLESVDDYQHITTAIGYLVDYEWPIRRDIPVLVPNIIPIKHHWNKA